MNMEQEGIFKTTTFGGFDKKSVLTYIDALTEKHHAEEEDLRSQIEEFTKAQDSQVAYIEKMEEQLAELEGKLEAVAGQLEEERAATPQAASQINDLNQQNHALEQKLSDTERELKIQLERNRQLQFKMEGATYKSQKYDEMSAQIGDAMLVAKANADGIVSDAQKEADRLLREAREQAGQTLREAQEQAQELTGQAQAKAEEQIGQAQAQAAQLTEQSEAKAAQLTEQAQAMAEQITQQAHAQLLRFGKEITGFRGDTARLRKSIEEILFVLNDRVDVMQEIARQMDCRSAEFIEETTKEPQQELQQGQEQEQQELQQGQEQQERASKQEQEHPSEPFAKAEDEAGYFGGACR